jgi:hypothetical protein
MGGSCIGIGSPIGGGGGRACPAGRAIRCNLFNPRKTGEAIKRISASIPHATSNGRFDNFLKVVKSLTRSNRSLTNGGYKKL